MEHAPLEAVYIFLDTATFDEIERDVKVTQLTMIMIGMLQKIIIKMAMMTSRLLLKPNLV